jgi:3-hydroxyisobutyrate dehydrogenase-like beta-hydroxyacid dehydrogenase
MKVGFIGLGTMGRHMAANLARAGHNLTGKGDVGSKATSGGHGSSSLRSPLSS